MQFRPAQQHDHRGDLFAREHEGIPEVLPRPIVEAQIQTCRSGPVAPKVATLGTSPTLGSQNKRSFKPARCLNTATIDLISAHRPPKPFRHMLLNRHIKVAAPNRAPPLRLGVQLVRRQFKERLPVTG